MHHPTDLGDHIGMESCVDLETDNTATAQPPLPVNRKPWGMILSKKSSSSGKKGKELPPPMPIQSSTVMKRYYTDDGRLIITEEKVETPKYFFTAHRSHGRLTLQFVPSDSESLSTVVENNKCNSSENGHGNEISGTDVCSSKVAPTTTTTVVGGGGGDGDGGNRGGVKCFGYNTAVRVAATGPCLFVNQNRQLHAIRPVQI